MSSLKTYILNYAPLVDRALWMESQLVLANFENYSFLQKDFDYNYYVYDKKLATKQGRSTSQNYEPRPLKKSEFDLIRKHQDALIDAYSSSFDNILILEDDALLAHGVSYNLILDKINSAPSDWDIIIMGGPFGHDLCTYSKTYPNFLLANHPSTNTSSSILYNRKIIPSIAASLQNAQIPLDWVLNHFYAEHNLKVYHIYPYLFTQNKIFKSAIQ
jgi:hypothetical protein